MTWKELQTQRQMDQEYLRLVDRDAMPHAIEQVQKQQEHRKLWQEGDDAETITKMILDEGHELQTAITESELSGDVFPVASEVADILYLTIRLCHELGFEPADLLAMKTLRNSMKYNDEITNNGYDRQEATYLARAGWQMMGGDIAFSHAYLDVYAKA